MWNDILFSILEDGWFAAIAAIGFSSISNTPHRAYPACALIAAAGHSIRYVLTWPEWGGTHIIPASTLASLAVGVLAVLFASRIK
ncbi:MAG: threonine/serine exporter family protein, partial [Bacteroides sp.]|nr:threonine/serine exporter family protein [Bacteroides sp.]